MFLYESFVILDADVLLICSVPVPPSISGESTVPREVQVTQDGAVTLECQAVGRPPPQISWLKNGQPLLLSPRTRLLSADSVLRSVLTVQSISTLPKYYRFDVFKFSIFEDYFKYIHFFFCLRTIFKN